MLIVLCVLFAAYILYRLLFHFVIPIWRTTRQVRRSFRDMQERMNGQMQGHAQSQPASGVNAQAPKASSKQGEYIDFEEVKE